MLTHCTVCSSPNVENFKFLCCVKCEHIAEKFLNLEHQLEVARYKLEDISDQVQKVTCQALLEKHIDGKHPLIQRLWEICQPREFEYNNLESFTHFLYIANNIIYTMIFFFNKKRDSQLSFSKKDRLEELRENIIEYIHLMKWEKDFDANTIDEFIHKIKT